MDASSHIPACAYRRVAETGPGGERVYVCDCAGGVPIGTVGEERLSLADICVPCTLPAEIDPSRRPCLFLIPVRLWEGGTLRTGFSCRWFYKFKPKVLPDEAWKACLGCHHWFPRPRDEEDIPRMHEWIGKIIRLYWEPLPQDDPIWGDRQGEASRPLRGRRIAMRIRDFVKILLGRRPGADLPKGAFREPPTPGS